MRRTGALAFLSVCALVGAGGCGGSTATSANDGADAPAVEVAAEAKVDAPDAAADVIADAAADVIADAPAEVTPVDASVEQPADAPEDLPRDLPAEAGADLAADVPIETGPVGDATDAPADAGAGDAPEGGCVSVPAPTVRWLNPLPQGNPLRAVWGSSADDVYVAGEYGTILHSADRGQSWQAQASGTTEALNGIWGSAANDVYVVGNQGTILHSTGGGTWTQMSLNTQQVLFSIWGASADDIYAVGTNGTFARRIARGAWTTRVLNANGVSPGYRSVWGAGGTVWAVGDSTVIRSVDGGTTWTTLSSPSSRVTAVTGTGGTLYLGALAYSPDPNIFTSTNGGDSWNPIRTPGGGGTWGLAAAGGSAYAVGTSGLFTMAANSGATFTALASGTTFSLSAVWASDAGDLYAVGESGLILHAASAGAAFAQTPALTRAELNHLWGTPTGDLIAVGRTGDIVQSSDRGAHLTLRAPAGSNPSSIMTGVAGFGNEVYAVGNAAILRSGDRGVTWAVDRPVGIVDNPRAVEVTSEGVFVVGDFSSGGSVLFKPTGGAWTTISAGANANLLDFFSADGETWLVGGDYVMHRAGGVFALMRISNGGSLQAIGGRSAASLVAAGGTAQIMTSTDRGATWQSRKACWPPEQASVQPGLTTSPLFDVCTGGGRTFIVGGNGAVLVSRDDVNWTSVPSGTFQQLMGCTVDDAGTLTVVGTGGNILSLTFPP